ncbi:MAG: hypothetical protein B5M54_03820 [Candidatus Aminicenantes bacterium 4484_214]|nr:MAG: hypothetical protein B5M54_03820 [Candidatus Aminicenantes bacterium 4484_214]RLE06375.1 MAG: hypothetical protein DRJ06_07940 [Candidatus Aminicenantes bacterium]
MNSQSLRKQTWLILLCALFMGMSRGLPSALPKEVGLSSSRLALIDQVVNEALQEKTIPGAVVCVGRQGKIVFFRSYGWSQLTPVKQEMQKDMLFDLASLTKPVATATAVMILVERGKISLRDRVKKFIPWFRPYSSEKEAREKEAQIWHLLTHTSGLPAYAEEEQIAKQFGRPCSLEQMVGYIGRRPKLSPPGREFRYSCLGFISLAYIVEQVSGQKFEVFVQENIFQPLGMRDTMFNPPPELKAKCVPTEKVGNRILQGVVHDPLARLLGGVSGNAGLFSSALDLATFAQMLLNGGQAAGVRILSPLSVRRLTEVFPLALEAGRGLGWDLNSPYNSPRGDLFGWQSFGHTGYTGTSLWIDPATKCFVILLTNRVHPEDKGSVTGLRTKVANIVASAIWE